MNEKVKGITFGAEIRPFRCQEGMKGLKRQLGVVNSEMKS